MTRRRRTRNREAVAKRFALYANAKTRMSVANLFSLHVNAIKSIKKDKFVYN